MFLPSSRYAHATVYTTRTADGETVTAIRLPIRAAPPVRGFHRRLDTQRPDLLAAHYLADAAGFWRLCDAGGAIAPDALAARPLVAIPGEER